MLNGINSFYCYDIEKSHAYPIIYLPFCETMSCKSYRVHVKCTHDSGYILHQPFLYGNLASTTVVVGDKAR